MELIARHAKTNSDMINSYDPRETLLIRIGKEIKSE